MVVRQVFGSSSLLIVGIRMLIADDVVEAVDVQCNGRGCVVPTW